MPVSAKVNQQSFSAFLKQNLIYVGLLILWIIVGGILLLLEEERAVYRWVNANNHSLFDVSMPYLTYLGEGLFVVSILLLLFLLVAGLRTNKRLIAVVIACNMVPFALAQIIKQIVNAPRPLKFFNEADWIHRVQEQPINYDFSFPSGHSEGAFALFTCIALILPQRFRLLQVLCFMLALSVGYSRIYLSQHFFADVYMGSLIGSICALGLFYWFYARKNRKNTTG